MIEFFVDGEPRQRGSKTAMPIYNAKTGWPQYHNKPVVRGGRVITYARPKMRYVDAAKGSTKWMEKVAGVAEQYRQDPLWEGPITMLCCFCYEYADSYLSVKNGEVTTDPRPSAPEHKVTTPDVIKLGRAVEDALSGVIYVDDNKVVDQHVIKCYSRYTGVFVRVWPHAQEYRYRFDAAIEQYLEKLEASRPF